MTLNNLLKMKGIIHRDPDIISGVPDLKSQVMMVLESAAKLLIAQERSA